MFGTDGIRGVFGQQITCSLAFEVGRALGIKCIKHKGKGIIVGRDTRPSGVALSMAIISGILSQGVNVTDAGVATTPAVGFMARQGYNFGVVLTASHNPSEYNGIKIFNKMGMKLSAKEESDIENVHKNINRYAYSKEVGKLKNIKTKPYFEFLASVLEKKKLDLSVCFDCANGAAGGVVKNVFKDRFKELFLINVGVNGININKGCGATSVGALRQFVVSKKLDFGFAFDGDADRVVMINNRGDTIDGDGILCILTEYFLSLGGFSGPVVGTVLTNLGLENYLSLKGIELFRTPVGDKFISEHMFKNKLVLGGEPAGHIILSKFNPTGDGILCSILLILAAVRQGRHPEKMLLGYKQIPQYYLNIKYEPDRSVGNAERLDTAEIVKKYVKKLDKNCRLVVRKSGTEPVIRVMIEGENKEKIERILCEIEEELDSMNVPVH
ncbi:MAG: hypothetical protein LBN07_01625 [Christensenellaceae bacterium]|jgi:phosphoglucosamine mutase|nr:hypothetical protein [Christensenellaceae bacterium]